MHAPLWAWFAVAAVIGGLLALDLFVLHRRAHAVTLREAAISSAGWLALGVSFGAIIWVVSGAGPAGEYFAGYLIEKSLSVDNIFVFALLLGWFAVPPALQHRVLFWGVVGALVLRLGFVLVGAGLLERFSWAMYLFGAFLVFTGVRMAVQRNGHVAPGRNPALRLLRRVMPVTDAFEGTRFFVRRPTGDGTSGQPRRMVRAATPLLAVLVAIETTDIVFAVDSIPAVFAVTDDPFLVFTSNAFAILGMRALFFLLADLMHRFQYLKVGLAAVLTFVGAKMLGTDLLHVPVWLSLLVIAAILAVAVTASLRRPVPQPAQVVAVTAGDQVEG